ncbi:MAG: hypothetical protein DRO40_13615 [Thermoprotei archaeon]|nr:MAG: hypothetical protein DRO40_13615 [Thermoprotei archaeon]
MPLDIDGFKLRTVYRFKPRTLKSVLSAIKLYDKFLSENGLEPSVESLALWLDSLQRQGYKPLTLRRYADCVRIYFETMMIPVDKDMLRAVLKRFPYVINPIKDYLTEEEVAKLIVNTKNPIRKLVYAIQYTYARRLSEVLNLRWGDINFRKHTIRFRILKRREEEYATYHLEGWIEDLLKKYFGEKHHSNKKVFPVTKEWIERMFRRDLEKAGVKVKGRRLTPHVLRSSRATHLLRRGVPIDVVSKYLLRHKRYETTVTMYRSVMKEEIAEIPSAAETLQISHVS